jgi:hypothetical protein
MRWSVFLCCIVAVSSSVRGAEDPEIIVELERNRIYEGESVLYRVTLNHVENPSTPILEGFDDFDVQSRGDQSLNSRKVMIINGRRSETVRYGRAYNFVLTPKRVGDLTIPAPTATVDGETLRGKSLVLRVTPPQEQDLAILEIRADKVSVYPTQDFTVTLTIAVRELPAPYASRDPVAVLRRNPALSIPWVNDDTLPKGLASVEPWQRWIGQYVDRGGSGFGINDLRTTSAFSFFGDSQSGFMPPSKRVRRKDNSEKTVGYREYTLSRTFEPTAVGEFSFGPVTLKGGLPARVDTSGRLEAEDIFAVAEPVTVAVKDAPLEGRPSTYSGAIGRFQWDAALTPTEAKAGDPMTLTLTLGGKGTLDMVPTPDPSQIPEIADAFKVYEATEESGDNQRRFVYGLRPLKAEIEAFPAITFNYFDVDKEQYVDLKTQKIPLRISGAERLSDKDIDVPSRSPSAAGGQVETQEGGIFANDSALRSLRDDSVNPVRWFVGLGSLAGVYAIALLLSQRIRRLVGDPDLVRRRTATSRARRRLQQAVVGDYDTTQQTDRLQAVFSGLVADASGVPEAGLTSGEARNRLQQLGIDDELDTRFGQWCEACDAARYGATSGAVDQLQQEARVLLDDVIQDLKQKRMLR